MVRLFQKDQVRPQWLQRMLDAVKPHKTVLMIAAGLAVQWSAVHFTVSRPLTRQISRMEAELTDSNSRLDRLVAARGSAEQTHDLLSALEAQRQSLGAAEQSLADIRQLRIGLEEEAQLTEAAAGGLHQLSLLQGRLTETGRAAVGLDAVLDRLEQLQAGVTALAQPTEESLARVEQVNRALSQMNLLQNKLAEQSQSLPAAVESLERSLLLQSTLADAGESTPQAQSQADRLVELAQGLNTVDPAKLSAAADHAADLLALHDMLADAQNLKLKAAEDSLQALLATQSDLLHATPGIAAAAENLELLTDFERELTRELENLTQTRKDLMEIALLRETVSQVAEAVQPLAELSDLRRLDGDQVRAMARELLERRTAQIFPPTNESVITEPIGPSCPLPQEPFDRPVPPPVAP